MIYRSKNIQNFDYKKSFKDGVIVFGTGNLGIMAIKSLQLKNIKLICFVDNNKNNQNKKFKNYDVISAEDLQKNSFKYPILICSNNFQYFKRQLESLNIKNYYDSDFLFDELDLDNCETAWSQERCKIELDLYNYAVQAARDKNKLQVNSLDLVLTEKCSLKCKDCSNLMQYYAKPVDEDFNLLVKSIDKFMSVTDYVQEIRLIGGEPFMYKKIDDVIKQFSKYSNFKKLIIYTNGTIVPKKERADIYKNDKIFLKISNYGTISRNVSKLEEFLSSNKINFSTERVTRWQDCAKIQKYDRDINLTKEIFGNCCVNDALTLLHGQLYLCPYSAHAENLKAIPISKSDSVDLNNVPVSENLRQQIRSLVFGKEYLEACKWCNGRDYNVPNVDAAIQTKMPLKYEKIN